MGYANMERKDTIASNALVAGSANTESERTDARSAEEVGYVSMEGLSIAVKIVVGITVFTGSKRAIAYCAAVLGFASMEDGRAAVKIVAEAAFAFTEYRRANVLDANRLKCE
jgi:hypothetical protein